MYRLVLTLAVVAILSGRGSSSDLKVSSSNPSSESNSVNSGDYTFTLILNDNSESPPLLTAELRYDGAEEDVVIKHSSEILDYEVFDENANVIYAKIKMVPVHRTIHFNSIIIQTTLIY